MTTNGLRLFLFGKLNAQHQGQALPDFETRKVQELLCYLLLYRDRPHRRESLADLLWPESSAAQVTKYLRHTLWQLQTALDGSGVTENGPILQTDAEWVGLHPGADLWFDVAEFERGCALVQEVPGGELGKLQVQRLDETLKLYRGDLLQGWYQDWCLFERERLQRMYLALLEKRMAYCEAHGEYQVGLECGTCALRHDMAHERIHRRLMRLHYLAGDRTAALRQYERCMSFLNSELGVAPSKRTVALYERIRSDHSLDLEEVMQRRNGKTPASPPVTLDQALQRLKQLQAVFIQTQRQLQDTIQAVEATLNDRD